MTELRVQSGLIGSSARMVTGRSSMKNAGAALTLSPPFTLSQLVGKGVTWDTLPTKPSLVLQRPKSLGTRVVTLENRWNSSTSTGGYVTHLPNTGFMFHRGSSTVGLQRGSVLEFKFKASNYFSMEYPANGHMAIGVRGSLTSGIEGKGVVIGDVSQYTPHDSVCGPTSLKADITFESFWSSGNCVFGERPDAQLLQNDTLYSVRVIADDVNQTIQFSIISEDGTYNRTDSITDPFYTNSAKGNVFFVGGVPDNSIWTAQFGDIYYYNFR